MHCHFVCVHLQCCLLSTVPLLLLGIKRYNTCQTIINKLTNKLREAERERARQHSRSNKAINTAQITNSCLLDVYRERERKRVICKYLNRNIEKLLFPRPKGKHINLSLLYNSKKTKQKYNKSNYNGGKMIQKFMSIKNE